MLERPSTRRAFERIASDTESLVVHRDSASFLSHYTDRLSKISVLFSFDGEIFASRVYDRVIRGSLKEALRRQQDIASAGQKRSTSIDHLLKKDSRRLKLEVKILLMGSPGSSKEDIVARMKMGDTPLSAERRGSYRRTVRERVVESAKDLIRAMERNNITPAVERNKGCTQYVANYAMDPSGENFDEIFARAVMSLWSDPFIQEMKESWQHTDFTGSTP